MDPERCPACGWRGKGGPRFCDDRWHSLRPGSPIQSTQTKVSVMADPTLEDDLAALHTVLAWVNDDNALDARDALRRIAAALKDREHLEEGARMLSSQLGWSISAGLTPKTEVMTWLERERARKQGNAGVAKETK